MSRKQLPPPDGGSDLAQALAARLNPAPPPQAPAAAGANLITGSGNQDADEPAATPPPRPRRTASRKTEQTRPSARDLAAPARPSIAREALKADVPAELALIQRLHRYRLDKGVDIRDQVAIAVDEWLTSEGY